MIKKNVLFVGDHPDSFSGNGNMLHTVLSQLDVDKYNPACFVNNIGVSDPFVEQKTKIIAINDMYGDGGVNDLLNTIHQSNIDYLVMVGIDIWRYGSVFKRILELKKNKPFCWVYIFPWDQFELRKDWIQLMNIVDVPCVYSVYGFDSLKTLVPRLKYFKPPLRDSDLYQPYSKEYRTKVRRDYFGKEADSKFIFGCVARNQVRKCIPTIMKAFFLAKKVIPDIALYIHSEFENIERLGVYNLKQIAIDMGAKTGDIITKKQGITYSEKQMVDIYNSLDTFINCSAQEGLSWTVLQAMLCGTPVIASETTSQTELIQDVSLSIKPTNPIYIPVETSGGMSHVLSYACSPESIQQAMLSVYGHEEIRSKLRESGLKRGKQWLVGSSNINDFLYLLPRKKRIEKNRLLFVQHSAAGDVLMTTRCLKGLKERYMLPIDYMTQEQYAGVLEDNPYIDRVLGFDENLHKKYRFVLNPHGDQILPGSWGRNSTSILSDFYWKILNLEPDDFYIVQKPIKDFEFLDGVPICIVQTSGGDKEFRSYSFMPDVCKGLKEKYKTVQLGSKDDRDAFADIDLRGKTTYAETAWIVNRASVAVTIDSYLSHLVGAIGVDQVCLFGSGNYNVVRPNQTKGVLVMRIPNYLRYPCLGPCSASVKNCSLKCTSCHNPKDILKDIDAIKNVFLENGESRIIQKISG